VSGDGVGCVLICAVRITKSGGIYVQKSTFCAYLCANLHACLRFRRHLCANYRCSAHLHVYMVLPSPTTCGRVQVAGLGDGSLCFITIKTAHPHPFPCFFTFFVTQKHIANMMNLRTSGLGSPQKGNTSHHSTTTAYINQTGGKSGKVCCFCA